MNTLYLVGVLFVLSKMDYRFLSYFISNQHAIYLICLSVALISKSENYEIRRFGAFVASSTIMINSIAINFIFFVTFHQIFFAYLNALF